ncbi:MAG TPA: hypothetical protein VH482_08160 [Thermomicrobiales bacterium]|jgi:hypothetical protein
MPRWLVIVLAAPLGLCVLCGSLGYFVALPKIQHSLSESQAAAADVMADAVATSVSHAITTQSPLDGQLVLTPTDIDVNNTVATAPGRCGFNVNNVATTIYGVETEISPSGLSIFCIVTYSAVPVVTDGRIDLTQVTVSANAARFVFPKERFEEGVEEGINRALTTAGLTPISLSLADDSLTIATSQTA